MRQETSQSVPVRCETCGKQYINAIDRCPRCQSNQKKLLPAHPRMSGNGHVAERRPA